MLERYAELKNEMHLYVDFNVLFGKKLPAKFDLSEISFHDAGNGVHTIDYYDIKKIKIIHDNARVKEPDKDEFFNSLLANLKIYYGEILYDGFIKDKLDIDEITSKEIILDIGNVKLVEHNFASRDYIAPIQGYKKEVKILNDKEAKILANYLHTEPNPRWKIALLTVLFMGLRRGELA